MREAVKESEDWIESVKDDQFQEMVVKLNSKLYDWLDGKRSKGHKISDIVTCTVKKIQDYIMLKSVAVIEELVELRTRVSEIQNYIKALDDIASKISCTSVRSAVKEIQVRQRRDDFAVLVSPVEPSMEVDDIKKAIKN